MSSVSTDRALNGMPNTTHRTVVKHGNLIPNEDISTFPSCPTDGDSCVPESVIALRNAYSILRDRYNKLKQEHQKLQKHLQKITEPNSKKKLEKSDSKIELNASLSEPAALPVIKILHSSISNTYDEPLSAGTLISELEQLREKLDKMSREAQSYVDTDLKGMMENVIPKLKELERQCSSLSEEGPRSLILLRPKETRVKSVSDEKFTSQNTDEVPGESIFQTPDQSLSEDLLPSSFVNQSNVDFVTDLLISTSTQLNDLKHIYEVLRQQNKRLKKMDSKPVNRQNIPEPDITSSPPESDWSMINRP